MHCKWHGDCGRMARTASVTWTKTDLNSFTTKHIKLLGTAAPMTKTLQSLIKQTAHLFLCPRYIHVSVRARLFSSQELHVTLMPPASSSAEMQRYNCAQAVFWVIREDDGNLSKVMSLKITYQVARRELD